MAGEVVKTLAPRKAIGDLSFGEKSPLHSSYERGCQGENSSPFPPRRPGSGDLHPALSPSWRGFWFYRFGSPRMAAAMPAPVADPNSTVSWNGGARRHSITKLRMPSVGLSANHQPMRVSRPMALVGYPR